MITLVDHFGAGFVIYIMATLEVIGIAWIYGLSNFCRDIEFMLNIKIGWYWKICWGFIVPTSLISIFIFTFVNSTTLTHNNHEFPTIALGE
jgi:solute carrier family 6 amino acid transporter-like protein 5/7/9/14